ncbi:hypothetical protein, partial [Salmonella sp. SAL4431]|uniref:hypothetical protein n=1 Tax=Salmonella sp. SAL4431 TaxID=3159886 RepID=UPI003979F200
VILASHIPKVFMFPVRFVDVRLNFTMDRIDCSRAVDELHNFSQRADGIDGDAFDNGRFSSVSKRNEKMRNLAITRQH